MYVCICHSVTDKAIRKAVQQGHDTLEAIQEQLRVGTGCGRCKQEARTIIEESLSESSFNFALAQEVFA